MKRKKKTKKDASKVFSIKAVSIRCGLSAHVIRVWEKRYQAVTPDRTETQRRVYSEADVERLFLLRKATEAGHRIGQIAGLSRKQLLKLIPPSEVFNQGDWSLPSEESQDEVSVDSLIKALKNYDVPAIEQGLARAAVSFSRPHLIEQILIPFIIRVGDMWHEGTLRVAHEHLATTMIRSFVGHLDSASGLPPSAPCVVVTTPAGQIHEMGALMAAATAMSVGWRVIYLGPNLPAEEICMAVEENKAKAVALSIVYPGGDVRVREELLKLKLLPANISVIVGGRASKTYSSELKKINAILLPDVASLRNCFNDLELASRS